MKDREIKNKRHFWQPAPRLASDYRDIAVTLDQVDECQVVLPGIVRYLEAKLPETETVFNRRRVVRIQNRIAEINLFLEGIERNGYKEEPSFELTPQESEMAAQQNDDELSDPMMGQRMRVAVVVGMCMAAGWREAFSIPELPASPEHD